MTNTEKNSNSFKMTTVILMVVSLAAAFIMSRDMTNLRIEQKHLHYTKSQVGAIALGFDNFVSDVMWIKLVQRLGGRKGKLTQQEATYLGDQFKRLAQLDPGFGKALSMGARHIENVLPNKALEIFEVGTDYRMDLLEKGHNKKDEWRIPFYGAIVASRYLTEKKEGYSKAMELCLKAMDMGAPDYVERYYALCATNLKLIDGQLLKALSYRQKLLENEALSGRNRQVYVSLLNYLAENIVTRNLEEMPELELVSDEELAKAKVIAAAILKEAEAPKCPGCKGVISLQQNFCQNCGQKLKK